MINVGGKSSKSVIEQIANKAHYDGNNLISLLQSYSGLKEKVYIKSASATLYIAVFYSESKAVVYTMKQDGDGWWRLFDVVIHQMTKAEIDGDWNLMSNYTSNAGTWNTSSMPTYYTTTVGTTFSGTFDGTGFNFNSRTDNRGGIWEFLIDNYIKVTISTWSSAQTENVSQLVVKGLKQGTHSYVATFKGDDPSNVPSSGAGTARGWCNFLIGTNTSYKKTITPIVETYTEDTGTAVMQASSRKEFAFSVKPNGASYGSQWVPEHGVLGVMKNISYKIFFDDREVIGVSQESTIYRPYASIRFTTSYNAYHPSETNPLWSGRLDQTINSRGFHINGKMTFLQDTIIGVAHPAMLAIDKTNTENNMVVTGKGKRYSLPTDINDDSDINLTEIPSSVIHFNSGSSNQTLKNLAIGIQIHDLENTVRLGKQGQAPNPVFVRLRSDGHRKFYAKSHENYVAVVGEKYNFGATYFVGEIYNSTDVLN